MPNNAQKDSVDLREKQRVSIEAGGNALHG